MGQTKNEIIAHVKNLLGTLTDIKYVGDYPDNIETMGVRNAVLLSVGGTLVERGAGLDQYTWNMTLYCYLPKLMKNKTTITNTFEKAIIDKILSNESVGGVRYGDVCTNILVDSIDRGVYSTNEYDRTSAGVYRDNVVFTIDFSVTYENETVV